MTKFAALAINQYRYQFVVFRFKFRVGIDIDHFNAEMGHASPAAQDFQRGEHVVAQVAVVAAVQPQPQRRPVLLRSIYRISP